MRIEVKLNWHTLECTDSPTRVEKKNVYEAVLAVLRASCCCAAVLLGFVADRRNEILAAPE